VFQDVYLYLKNEATLSSRMNDAVHIETLRAFFVTATHCNRLQYTLQHIFENHNSGNTERDLFRYIKTLRVFFVTGRTHVCDMMGGAFRPHFH